MDYEVILVNDGSTDKSPLICEHLAKTHNQIILINKTNGGLSSARNAGIDVATGEYIIFLDGDDLWNNDEALEKLNSIVDPE